MQDRDAVDVGEWCKQVCWWCMTIVHLLLLLIFATVPRSLLSFLAEYIITNHIPYRNLVEAKVCPFVLLFCTLLRPVYSHAQAILEQGIRQHAMSSGPDSLGALCSICPAAMRWWYRDGVRGTPRRLHISNVNRQAERGRADQGNDREQIDVAQWRQLLIAFPLLLWQAPNEDPGLPQLEAWDRLHPISK